MLPKLLVLGWLLSLIYQDWRYRRLPNWLTLLPIPIAVLVMIVHGQGLFGNQIPESLLAGLIGFLAFLPAYLVRAMGAGDVKLLAALGVVGGPSVLLPVFIVSSLLAGAYALVLLGRMGRLAGFGFLLHCYAPLPNESLSKRALPYGVALALAFMPLIFMPGIYASLGL